MIPFNKPFTAGRELGYIEDAIASGRLSGDGEFSKRCERLLEERYGFHRALLTTSCTDALEMAAILCNIGPGDEVIAPSFAFTSTVNAFALRGAKIVFADSCALNPNIDVDEISALITKKTRATNHVKRFYGTLRQRVSRFVRSALSFLKNLTTLSVRSSSFSVTIILKSEQPYLGSITG